MDTFLRFISNTRRLWSTPKKVRKVLVIGLLLFGGNRLYNFLYRKINNYPPGPYGFPFIGIIFLNAIYGWQGFDLMIGKTYGDIAMYYRHNSPIVKINDLSLAKLLFLKEQKTNLLYRDGMWTNVLNEPAFADLNGEKWHSRRQLSHKSLSLLIDSKYVDNRIHTLVLSDLFPTLDEFADNGNKYYFRKDLKYTMFTFLFAALFANYVQIPTRTDERYVNYLKNQNIFWGTFITKTVARPFKNNFILKPIIEILLKNSLANVEEKQRKCLKELHDFFGSFLDEYKNNQNNCNESKEDCYIKRQIEFMNLNQIKEDELISDTMSLFVTAMHITLGEIETVVYFAAKYIGQQEIVYNELKEYYKTKENTGIGFQLNDVKYLHFFRAFIHEIMRMNFVGAGTLPRHLYKHNIVMGGYNIPYGAQIEFNGNFNHRNPKYWGDNVNEFDLHRWLNDKNQFKKHPSFVLFGLGGRSCVGESIAMREIYAVLAPLLYRYQFKIPNDIKKYDIPTFWFTPDVEQLPLLVLKRK